MSLLTEEAGLLNDAKYRQYVAAMDKVLRIFESTSEWADLISALVKLNKVLSSHIKFPVIPRRIVIGKRLSQCMHPALPSGVHLRALECYDVMFKCMGTNRLSQELFVYGSGLFPLLGHAAMTVRPQLLTIYETHFVPLGTRLRPALCGFLCGVLPGLEEGSDFFERTTALIRRVCEAVGELFFYGRLWRCVLDNTSVRLPGVMFALMQFDRGGAGGDVVSTSTSSVTATPAADADRPTVMGDCVDTVVAALCAAVADSGVLVQRFALDLLLAAFPAHSGHLTRAARVRLTTAALSVLLRRDMSLNRRLFNWLLGPDTSAGGGPDNYFDVYSRRVLVDALVNCLRAGCRPAAGGGVLPDLRAYRMLVSLLDKPEIRQHPVVIDSVLIEVLRALNWTYCAILDVAAPEIVGITSVGSASGGGSHKHYSGAGAVTSDAVEEDTTAAAADNSGVAASSSAVHSAAVFERQHRDMVNIVNLVFSSLDICYAWNYMSARFSEACRRVRTDSTTTVHVRPVPVGGGDPSVAECCALISFLLDTTLVDTGGDVLAGCLPRLAVSMLQGVRVALTEPCVGRLAPDEFACALDTCRRVLHRAQPSWPQLRRCLSHFGRLLSALVRQRVLQDPMAPDSVVALLACPLLTTEHRERTLQRLLLQQCRTADVHGDDWWQRPDMSPLLSTVETPSTEVRLIEDQLATAERCVFRLSNSAEAYVPAFVSSCRLLVLLSWFPGADGSSSADDSSDDDDDDQSTCDDDEWTTHSDRQDDVVDGGAGGENDSSGRCLLGDAEAPPLPEWLAALLAVVCFVPADDLGLVDGGGKLTHCSWRLNFAGCQALLDLSALVGSHGGRGVLAPVLTRRVYRWLLHGTLTVQLLGVRLWRLLGAGTPHLHVPAVGLLQLLASLAPAQLVETQLLAQLVKGGVAGGPSGGRAVEEFDRFSVLWHLSGDTLTGGGGGGKTATANFDRCLLWALDCLSDTTATAVTTTTCAPLQTAARAWLTHTLQRGDVARVLAPLLLLLLHPSTARVRVRHAVPSDSWADCLSPDSTSAAAQDANADGGRGGLSAKDSVVLAAVENAGEAISETSALTAAAASDVTDRSSLQRSAASRVKRLMSAGRSKTSSTAAAGTMTRSKSPLRSALAGPLHLFVNPVLTATATATERRRPSAELAPLSVECPPHHHQKQQQCRLTSDDLPPRPPPPTLLVRCASQGALSQAVSRSSCLTTANIASLSTTTAALDGHGLVRCSSAADGQQLRYQAEQAEQFQQWRRWQQHAATAGSDSERVAAGVVDQLVDRVLNECVGYDAAAWHAAVRCRPSGRRRRRRVHPLHDSFMLVYVGSCDWQRLLYGLRTLRAVLETDCRLVLCGLATSRLSDHSGGGCYAHIQTLLACHQRSVDGAGFETSAAAAAAAAAGGERYDSGMVRSQMLLETVLLVCVRFMCSYLSPGDMRQRSPQQLPSEQLQANRQLQLLAAEILTCMCGELVTVVRSSGRGFAAYLCDVMTRCRLQSTVLACVLSTVRQMDTSEGGSEYGDQTAYTFSEHIVAYNDGLTDGEMYQQERHQSPRRRHGFSEAFQTQLVRLVSTLIILEHHTNRARQESHAGVSGETWTPSLSTSSAADASNRVTFMAGSTAAKVTANHASPASIPACMRYVPDQPVPAQPMFLQALLSALRQSEARHLHRHWLWLVTVAMPFVRRPLPHLVISVVTQVAHNAQQAAALYSPSQRRTAAATADDSAPPDYLVCLLESLTVICHYCLVDSGGGVGGAVSGGHLPLLSYAPHGPASAGSGGGGLHFLSSLTGTFVSSSTSAATTAKFAGDDACLLNARRLLLINLPRIMATLVGVWQAVSASTQTAASGDLPDAGWSRLLGDARTVRRQIVDLLTPLVAQHGGTLVLSLAIGWHDRRTPPHGDAACRWRRQAVPQPTTAQLVVVDVLMAVRALSCECLVQTVRQLVKQHLLHYSSSSGASSTSAAATSSGLSSLDGTAVRLSHVTALLQLLGCSLRRLLPQQLIDTWPPLGQLLRDAAQLAPPALFAALSMTAELSQRLPPLMERRDVKELQDVSCRLVEACATVAGACLEPTTWLRRNLSVRTAPALSPDELQSPPPPAQPPPPAPASSLHAQTQPTADKDSETEATLFTGELTDATAADVSARDDAVCAPAASTTAATTVDQPDWFWRQSAASSSSSPTTTTTTTVSGVQWSVAALRALAELLAPMLDVLYQSDEKERVLPLLQAVMQRVTPYLRHHGRATAPAFVQCSRLLASLSEHQFARRAWRREAFELLLEPAFFSMQPRCLPLWRCVIDSLMTYDRSTFKELLARALQPPAASLNPFSSRDAGAEQQQQRCQLLKRLAFVVYCSQSDQYQPYLPDIQERLAECLRVQPPPLAVHACVVLCFRVLLLRLSSASLVSLWPIIVTELVQALLSVQRRLEAACETHCSAPTCSSSSSWPCSSTATDDGDAASISTLDSALSMSVASSSACVDSQQQQQSNGLLPATAADVAGWRQLQLDVCKLLEMCLLLTPTRLPQFQMYRWAFVGGDSPDRQFDVGGGRQQQSLFVPHVVRIAALCERLTQCVRSLPTDACADELDWPSGGSSHAGVSQPLLVRAAAGCGTEQLLELAPFYQRLAALGGGRASAEAPTQAETVRAVEEVLEADFLEPLQPGL